MNSGYDTYFMKCAQSWGQIWMKRQWQEFMLWYTEHNTEFQDTEELPPTICSWSSKSWLKHHIRYCIEQNKYFVYPYVSLSSNCGEYGTHLDFSTPVFQRPLSSKSFDYTYQFPDLNQTSVKYDGFLEFELLYNYININREELCVDLNRSKHNYLNKRYLLTTRALNYKIIKSFGLAYQPMEENVIKRCEGNSIFLYDTYTKANKPVENKRLLYAYYNRVDIFASTRRLFKFGLFNLIKIAIRKIMRLC
jgi:hypothetical protein